MHTDYNKQPSFAVVISNYYMHAYHVVALSYLLGYCSHRTVSKSEGFLKRKESGRVAFLFFDTGGVAVNTERTRQETGAMALI